MCFHNSFKTTVQIAEKDIVCWKILKQSGRRDGIFYSIFQSFEWKRNVLYRTILTTSKVAYHSIDDLYIPNCIEKGFHAYRNRELARGLTDFRLEGVHKCIIPKGSRYFQNKEEIVSNQMILIK